MANLLKVMAALAVAFGISLLLIPAVGIIVGVVKKLLAV